MSAATPRCRSCHRTLTAATESPTWPDTCIPCAMRADPAIVRNPNPATEGDLPSADARS